MSVVSKLCNRKMCMIAVSVLLIAAIVILAVVFGNKMGNNGEPPIIQAAKNAYREKNKENNKTELKYMLFCAEGKWVALKEGVPVGVYESEAEAVSTLVENSADYQVIPSSTDEIYYVLSLSDYVPDLSELVGKKITCVGDSVTFGVGANPEPNYVRNLGAALDTNVVNLGASGYSLCEGGDRDCQFVKFNATDLRGADIVTVYLGVNDWASAGFENGKPFYALGTPDSTDTSTIYGAMKMWCDKIVELKQTKRYQDTVFYFLTPHLTSWNNSVTDDRVWDMNKKNIHGYTQQQMADAIKEVCATYDIPVIDLYSFTCKLYAQNPTQYMAEYAGDGVHPTPAWHKLVTDYILVHLSVK